MYCPTCGSEERQHSQFCRACGTDLRSVRQTLEKPDAVTASAVSAREEISRALADKIRQMDASTDLGQFAEVLLPGIEKFLESPEEKRLRRIRSGTITASIGLGATLAAIFLTWVSTGFFPLIGMALVTFFVGLGILINGLRFTVARRELADKSYEALAQQRLDSQTNGESGPHPPKSISAAETNRAGSEKQGDAGSSITEHTTHRLK